MQNISAGMKLWGVVAEVNQKDLVISLPGGLRGLVRSIDALDPVLSQDVEVLNASIYLNYSLIFLKLFIFLSIISSFFFLIFIFAFQGVEINLGSIFDVGQLVSCVVLQLDDDKKDNGKRKIWLSLCLSLLQKDLLNSIQEGMV